MLSLNHASHHTGLTLIEVMLALMISCSLLSILFSTVTALQVAAQKQTDAFNIIHHAVSLSRIFNNQIHQAGFIGCPQLSSEFFVLPVGAYSLQKNNRITGSDHDFTVRYRDAIANTLSAVNQHDYIVVSGPVAFHARDKLLISNCRHAEWFAVNRVVHNGDKQILYPTQPLIHQYDTTAEVARLHFNHFYIQTLHHQSLLFVEDINHQRQQLLTDVRTMNLTYTIEENGRLQQVDASAVHDWSLVRGVYIQYQLQSGKLEKPWMNYISLRN